MGFRFRRSFRIAPGVRINLSRSGVSTSLGPRGARYTIGHGKRRTTVGIPGTGLSYTAVESAGEEGDLTGAIFAAAVFLFALWIVFG